MRTSPSAAGKWAGPVLGAESHSLVLDFKRPRRRKDHRTCPVGLVRSYGKEMSVEGSRPADEGKHWLS